MKMNLKKMVFSGILATSILVNTIPAIAATTTYNFTLNEGGINDDPISKRTVKDNSIQVFTVKQEVYTGVAPGQDAAFTARSCELNNANVRSNSIKASINNTGSTLSGTYDPYHPASNNKYYYLEATYVQGPGSFGTSGKYTP